MAHDFLTCRWSDAGITYLLPETDGRNKNCAAFWPSVSGWHLAVSENGELPFYVRDADEAPGLQAKAIRETTLVVAGQTSRCRKHQPHSDTRLALALVFGLVVDHCMSVVTGYC